MADTGEDGEIKHGSKQKGRVVMAMELGKDNYKVDLAKPIPVLILYGTAIVDEANEVHFFQTSMVTMLS